MHYSHQVHKPGGEEFSRIPKLARIRVSIGRRQSESRRWIVSRGTTCQWFTLMIHWTGRKKAKGLRSVSREVHYVLRGRRMPREHSRESAARSVGQLITWNNYVLFWRRRWRWQPSARHARDVCAHARVKTHVGRTSWNERANKWLRKVEEKGVQKRAKTRGREDIVRAGTSQWRDGGGSWKRRTLFGRGVLVASHTRRDQGKSPSTLVTPAQNTGARNIHDRIVHGRGDHGRAEDRTSRLKIRSFPWHAQRRDTYVIMHFFYATRCAIVNKLV